MMLKMLKMPEITKNRLEVLLAAEEFCKAARQGIVDRGMIGNIEYPWFDRWMRLAGKNKYDPPKPVKPTWCCSCKHKHIAGNCDVN